MEVDFQVTKKDFVLSQKAAENSRIPRENKLILTLIGMMGLLCGAAGYVLYRNEEILVRLAWLLMAAIGGYVALYYPVTKPVSVRCAAAGEYRRLSEKQVPRQVSLREDQIFFREGSYELSLPLSYLTRLIETRDTMLFFWDLESFFFIPKRVLTEEQANSLRNCMPFSK